MNRRQGNAPQRRRAETAVRNTGVRRHRTFGCSDGEQAQRPGEAVTGIELDVQPIGLEMKVTGGAVLGMRDAQDPDLRQYHGIPYAAPPVGDLRWAPPAPVVPWQGVLDATAPRPVCIQRTHVGVAFYDPPPGAMLPEQSENCLTLNVWTEAAHAGERRPVMVWIHGGGLQAGSGSGHSGRLLAGHGAVVVTTNYRLGRLGYLAHPELTAEGASGVSGNQGYRDQIQALQWVRANIAKFGGDPNNITIFGESAGAYSVAVLQASPLARGLFHRVIGQSGGAFHPMSHRTENRTYSPSAESPGLRFTEALLVEQDDQSLAAMRRVPAGRVLETAESRPLFNTYETLSTVDGELLPNDVGTIFAVGQQADIPVLVGSNADEGTALLKHFTGFMGAGIAGLETFAGAMLPEAKDVLAGTSVRFAQTGNPNGGQLPEWPAYAKGNETYLEIGRAIRPGENLRVMQLELIEKAWAERWRVNSVP